MSTQVFVSGGNGFIGRHVVAGMVRARHLSRVLLSRPNREFSQRFPQVTEVHGDLLDATVLDEGLDGATAAVHLAAKNIDHDSTGFDRINVEGTRQLAQRALAAKVRRLIYVSSVGVYGHGSHRLADESTPVHPDTPFSRSKAAAEEILLDHHRRGDFEVAILRHRFVYGDGDAAVLPRLIRAARKYPFWISGGRATMSLIWAADLATIIARLAAGEGELDRQHPVYHVTDGQPLAYRQMISTLCKAFDWQTPRFSIPLPLLYFPVRWRERLLGIDPEVSQSSITSMRLKLVAEDHSFSNARLLALLPDLEMSSFDQGLAASFDYYRPFAEAS